MSKSFFYLLPVIGLVFFSCTGNSDPAEHEYVFNPPQADSAEVNAPFYPYHDYLRSQIAYVDSTPLGIEKTMEVNGKLTDSGFISKDAFRALAQAFLEIDPNNPALKPDYTETSFTDLTTNRITFSISTKNDSLPLQNADILLNADNQQVKNVLLKKRLVWPDSSCVQHLVWVDNFHFQISETIAKKSNGRSYTRVTRVVWDKPLQ